MTTLAKHLIDLYEGPARESINTLSGLRIDAALASKPHLKTASGYAGTIELRSTVLGAALDPEAASLARHHISRAQNEELHSTLQAVRAPMDDPIYGKANGGRRHRVKLIRELPDNLETRLEPAFSRGDLWDPDGRIRQRYRRWREAYLRDVLQYSKAKDFDLALAALDRHLPELEGVLEAALAQFE